MCVCVFFYSWTFFLWISPCFNIVSCQSFIWCIKLPSPSLMQWNTMLGCMTSFALERQIPHTFIAITWNNDVVWFMSWTPPSLTSFMISCIMSPIRTNVFSMGVDELEGWLWSFFLFKLGEVSSSVIKPAHINNPWFFRVSSLTPLHHQIHCHKCANR